MTGGICAVIPNWNRADLLSEVLSGLARQTEPPARVIVVDNGSTDASSEVASRHAAEVLQLPRNKGFAYAVNRGIEACRSEWVLLLNNDVALEREWLATLSEAAIREKTWFAVGKLRSASKPELLDGTWDAVCRGGTAWRCGSGRADSPHYSEPRPISFPPLTAALLRRDLFDRVGLLDESFESYLEDIDFGLRCAAAGLSGVYVPDAVALHAGSATLGAWHKATVRRLARNQILLTRKHFRGAPRWPILVAQLLWGLIAVRHGAALAWLEGRREGRRVPPPADGVGWPAIRETVEASEAQIRRLQSETGFDLYWKLYFALVRAL